MAYRVPNGSLVYIASGMATAVSMTALSNAAEAVATATNTYTAGDVLLINSGWSAIDNCVALAKSPSASSVTLQAYDTLTQQATKFPAGGGAGTLTKVSGWTQLGQIANSQSSGGDQQFTEVQFLESASKVNLPTVKAPYTLKFDVADDPALAGQILAATADDDRTPRVVRVNYPGNGGTVYFYAYITKAPMPKMDVNNLMTVEVTLSLVAAVKRY